MTVERALQPAYAPPWRSPLHTPPSWEPDRPRHMTTTPVTRPARPRPVRQSFSRPRPRLSCHSAGLAPPLLVFSGPDPALPPAPISSVRALTPPLLSLRHYGLAPSPGRKDSLLRRSGSCSFRGPWHLAWLPWRRLLWRPGGGCFWC